MEELQEVLHLCLYRPELHWRQANQVATLEEGRERLRRIGLDLQVASPGSLREVAAADADPEGLPHHLRHACSFSSGCVVDEADSDSDCDSDSEEDSDLEEDSVEGLDEISYVCSDL